MKTKSFFSFLLLLATCLVGSSVFCSCSKEDHDYVDLGLPSGTLWATCNVGASSPEEYGDYFAWGETAPKSDYSWWTTYKYFKSPKEILTKYRACNTDGRADNKTELEAMDDAATVNWGSGWQMPSYEQFDELFNSSYTAITWTTLNGVSGYEITSKNNGNNIFLPAAGLRETSLYGAGSLGRYWSRSLYTSNSDYAYSQCFDSGGVSTCDGARFYGLSVRPVRVKK